ncbi:uncharacterized protein DEA37_0001669 [Paragonimus westermani]|uniref:Major facilitator superfamily (MFS) profile domain-containing protein n=1 Tax=Paragonimus westermani TaxID=34504 RepID=A0A5J4P0U1_9TREM|nr:uncharacterized protein DEA37_0001669 [Paragonimus westermani]
MDCRIEVEPPAKHSQKQRDKFELNVDQLLIDIVQPCGLWQWMVTLLLMLSSTSIATFPVYANSASPHRCRMEPHIEQFIEQNNLSFTHVASRIGPWDDATTNGTLLSSKDLGCFRYRSDWSAENGVAILHANSSKDWTDHELERCPLGFVFEESNYHYPGTVVAEFATGMCAVYMPELFPSEVRTQGYGVATGIGRFISMSCLFLNELDKVTAHGVPLLIYSSLLLITLVALAVLPETSGENLSDLGKMAQSRRR